MAAYMLGIGAVPNNKAEEFESLQTTSLCYCNAKPTLTVLLTFIKAEKTKCEILILVFFFLLILLFLSLLLFLCRVFE